MTSKKQYKSKKQCSKQDQKDIKFLAKNHRLTKKQDRNAIIVDTVQSQQIKWAMFGTLSYGPEAEERILPSRWI